MTNDGRAFRFEQVSRKVFLTSFGEIPVNRRLYQSTRDGRSYVPLDERWGMQGQYATAEVRESVLYSVALMSAEESACLPKRCALFRPSSIATKHIVSGMGEVIEAHKETLDHRIQEDEQAPEGTETVVISLDGVNVKGGRQNVQELGSPSRRKLRIVMLWFAAFRTMAKKETSPSGWKAVAQDACRRRGL